MLPICLQWKRCGHPDAADNAGIPLAELSDPFKAFSEEFFFLKT
jgi:hypothetical protein